MMFITRKCTVEGCRDALFTKGMCKYHYQHKRNVDKKCKALGYFVTDKNGAIESFNIPTGYLDQSTRSLLGVEVVGAA
jgi:hypothetical protein